MWHAHLGHGCLWTLIGCGACAADSGVLKLDPSTVVDAWQKLRTSTPVCRYRLLLLLHLSPSPKVLKKLPPPNPLFFQHIPYRPEVFCCCPLPSFNHLLHHLLEIFASHLSLIYPIVRNSPSSIKHQPIQH